MPFADVAGLYGQTILPFLVGVMLVGHALRKHGLAVRISLAILSLPGVARSSGSLLFALLIASTVISALVNDLAVIVTMTPIALSLTRSAFAALDAGGPGPAAAGAPRMAAAASLAVLYGASGGGLATPGGQRLQPADPRGAGADDHLQRHLCAVDIDRRRSRGGPRSHLLPDPEVDAAAGGAGPSRSQLPHSPATRATGSAEPRREERRDGIDPDAGPVDAAELRRDGVPRHLVRTSRGHGPSVSAAGGREARRDDPRPQGLSGRRRVERAVSGCRRHGAGQRTDPTGGDRLDWGRVRGKRRGDGVAVAGGSDLDGGDATGPAAPRRR